MGSLTRVNTAVSVLFPLSTFPMVATLSSTCDIGFEAGSAMASGGVGGGVPRGKIIQFGQFSFRPLF